MATLAVGLSVFGADKPVKNPITGTSEIVWAGLDYSQVRMIGPGEFVNPDAIFPRMLEAWNNLFLQERIPFVQKEAKKSVVIDIDAVTEANKKASGRQIINSPGADDTINHSHITPEQIAKMVKGYDLKNKSGLGVVFIVDRLVKVDKKGSGAVYVVAFDIATRQVVFSEREIGRGVGFGFRNYWFRVIKEAEKGLKNIR
jgi:hypothetical protein